MQTTLDIGCVWEIDGKEYRVVGREGFSDGDCVDLQRMDVAHDFPPSGFCEIHVFRTDPNVRFVRRGATLSETGGGE